MPAHTLFLTTLTDGRVLAKGIEMWFRFDQFGNVEQLERAPEMLRTAGGIALHDSGIYAPGISTFGVIAIEDGRVIDEAVWPPPARFSRRPPLAGEFHAPEFLVPCTGRPGGNGKPGNGHLVRARRPHEVFSNPALIRSPIPFNVKITAKEVILFEPVANRSPEDAPPGHSGGEGGTGLGFSGRPERGEMHPASSRSIAVSGIFLHYNAQDWYSIDEWNEWFINRADMPKRTTGTSDSTSP
jgi:hypothetical protein